MADAKVEKATFVATLSDGSTAVEESGEWVTLPGERKPWVRLCNFAYENGLYLTSLRLNYKGTTIHLPREKFSRFGLEDVVVTPDHYSLSYQIEAEIGGEDGGFGNEQLYIDLAAHFEEGFVVHYIQQITTQDHSWVVVTKGAHRMAESPSRISPENSDAQIEIPAE